MGTQNIADWLRDIPNAAAVRGANGVDAGFVAPDSGVTRLSPPGQASDQFNDESMPKFPSISQMASDTLPASITRIHTVDLTGLPDQATTEKPSSDPITEPRTKRKWKLEEDPDKATTMRKRVRTKSQKELQQQRSFAIYKNPMPANESVSGSSSPNTPNWSSNTVLRRNIFWGMVISAVENRADGKIDKILADSIERGATAISRVPGSDDIQEAIVSFRDTFMDEWPRETVTKAIRVLKEPSNSIVFNCLKGDKKKEFLESEVKLL